VHPAYWFVLRTALIKRCHWPYAETVVYEPVYSRCAAPSAVKSQTLFITSLSFLNYTIVCTLLQVFSLALRGSGCVECLLISWRWTVFITTMNNCEICTSGSHWCSCWLFLSRAKYLLPHNPSAEGLELRYDCHQEKHWWCWLLWLLRLIRNDRGMLGVTRAIEALRPQGIAYNHTPNTSIYASLKVFQSNHRWRRSQMDLCYAVFIHL